MDGLVKQPNRDRQVHKLVEVKVDYRDCHLSALGQHKGLPLCLSKPLVQSHFIHSIHDASAIRAPPVYVQTEPWEEYGSIGTLEQSNHSESFFGSEVADGSNDIK